MAFGIYLLVVLINFIIFGRGYNFNEVQLIIFQRLHICYYIQSFVAEYKGILTFFFAFIQKFYSCVFYI